MSDIVKGTLTIMIVALLLLIAFTFHFYNECKDLEDTIEIKNNKIQELEIELNNSKMAQDEYFELFSDCLNHSK